MQTTFMSRRRLLGVLAAAAAMAASPIPFRPARAAGSTTPTLPDTDRAKTVTAWLAGGRATRALAAQALTGTDTEVSTFLTQQLAKATAEDNRVAVFAYMANAGRAMGREATAALVSGDAAIASFLKSGYKPAVTEDLRVATAAVINVGGRAVKREGTAALDAGTDQALERFIIEGRWKADEEDMRVESAKIMFGAGPEVTKYADRAMKGTDADLGWFLEVGQHLARARDQEKATIKELVAVVEREGKLAKASTNLAVEASQRAQTAAAEAKKAAEKAAAEAEAAKNDVAKSGAAARKAAIAARGAADAASIAIRASSTAVEASRRAARAATGASQAAAVAGFAASTAYKSAIAASKDASKAKDAKDAAVAARDAASKARSAAKAADEASTASSQAAAAGDSAASAAREAAAAAKASAQAATSAGIAQSEAAEAKRQAAIATTAANQATNAASTAQSLANASATAAKAARDAANSAAGHAEKAAAAAEEAVKYAGQAIDYANKSTAHAAEAVKAADTATQTVAAAVKVAADARAAEWASLEEDRRQAMEEAKELAIADTAQRAAALNKRTQDLQTSQATKDLISKAEQALTAQNFDLAVPLGRKAAVALLSSKGTWTRQAAQFALAGTDYDILSWIDLDRALAQAQDDRETILYIAQISGPAVAEGAAQALASGSDQAEGDFNTGGIIQRSAEENRVLIFKILDDDPGKAVKKAADKALATNTPQSLQEFFDKDLGPAVEEDTKVKIASLINSGGPYTKAFGEVALVGPIWMMLYFVQVLCFKTAQLDFDSASHAAAIQAAISAAAKIAQEAQRDAAHASKAAADARNAAEDAGRWARKALDAQELASAYAEEANDNANAAEKSANDAQAQADKAKAAANVATRAARNAKYSANKAVDAAHSALTSAHSARDSAAAAYQSALDAGKSASDATKAAYAARQIVMDKRKKELAEQARVAAEQAKKDKDNQHNPADNPKNDQVNPNGTGDYDPVFMKDAAYWADYFEVTSGFQSLISLGALGTVVVFPGAAPIAALVSTVTGGAAIGSAALSGIFNGIEYGWNSKEFYDSASRFALSLMARGRAGFSSLRMPVKTGKVLGPVFKPVGQSGSKIMREFYELVA